jgi:hypothetical protein
MALKDHRAPGPIEKPVVHGKPGRYRVKHLEFGAFLVEASTPREAAEKWLKEKFPEKSEDQHWVDIQRVHNMRCQRLADAVKA